MSASAPFISQLQAYSERKITQIQTCPKFQQVQALPPLQRYSTWAGLFLVSQIIVFGTLYLTFGSIVVVGFFASIVAGLATGVGALPALWFKNISNNLFNSLLGGAAGVMLAASTAGSKTARKESTMGTF